MALAVALLVGLAMIGWTAIDADRRGRNWFAWAALVAVTGILGFVVWLLVRRRSELVSPPPSIARRAALPLVGIPLLLVTFLIAGFVVTNLAQMARVEGRAMSPTLNDQDRLLVNKVAYQLGEPKVSEIVMLRYPLNPTKKFVKRVLAEEGDQVRIVDGQVYRNDVPMQQGYVPVAFRSHEDWGPQVVPEGYYFVMGDHRNNSSDSRHWGFVPKKYILGRVQCRWWPVSNARCF